MPCYDSRDHPDYVRAEVKRKFKADLDKLTRLLCTACKCIESHCGNLDDRELSEWWHEHQKLDERRKE